MADTAVSGDDRVASGRAHGVGGITPLVKITTSGAWKRPKHLISNRTDDHAAGMSGYYISVI